MQVLESGRPGWNFLFITYSKTSLSIINSSMTLSKTKFTIG